MAIPIPVLVVFGLILSAHARLNAIVLGQPVSVSALDLIAVTVVLILAVAALLLARSLAREMRGPRHRWANT